jgi:hypothetical protein
MSMNRWIKVVVSAVWLAIKVAVLIVLTRAGASTFVYQNF